MEKKILPPVQPGIRHLSIRNPAFYQQAIPVPLSFGVPLFVAPRVTAVACKRPRSFCKKCRWQVTPKHAYPLDPVKSEWADYTVQA